MALSLPRAAPPNGADEPRVVVTSAEFVRQFGHMRQIIGDAPVFVTHHGREANVMLSASHYARLVDGDAPGVPLDAEARKLPTIHELVEWLRQSVILLDADMRIVVANQVAHATTNHAAGELVGRDVYEAIPELCGSLIQTYINRAVAGRERCSADLPSVFRARGWIRLDTFALSGSTTVMFQDITEDVERNRMADAKQAILDAMSANGDISYVRLNTRAHIERVDAAMCALLHLPEERLRHIAFADLVPAPHRVAFREALDLILAGESAGRIDTVLLANNGASIPVRVAVSGLRGVYGNEGAVLIVTRIAGTTAGISPPA